MSTKYGHDAYMTRIAEVKDAYSEKIFELMRKLKGVIEETGFKCEEPVFEDLDNYSWSFGTVDEDGKLTEGFAATVEIAESRDYGDEVNGGDGINFSLMLVAEGGRIIGGFTPFNYSDECWVPLDDDDAISDRFAVFTAADMSEVPNLINGAMTAESDLHMRARGGRV